MSSKRIHRFLSDYKYSLESAFITFVLYSLYVAIISITRLPIEDLHLFKLLLGFVTSFTFAFFLFISFFWPIPIMFSLILTTVLFIRDKKREDNKVLMLNLLAVVPIMIFLSIVLILLIYICLMIMQIITILLTIILGRPLISTQ